MMSPKLVRGILLGGEFDKLIVQATVNEVAQFAAGSAVFVAGAPVPGGTDWTDVMSDGGGFLYDRHGRPAALISQIDVRRQNIDVTSSSDSSPQMIAGPMEVLIRARGI